MLCAIWYHFYDFKKVIIIHAMEQYYFLVKLQVKSNFYMDVLSRFLNCTNGTKSHKASHIEHDRQKLDKIEMFHSDVPYFFHGVPNFF